MKKKASLNQTLKLNKRSVARLSQNDTMNVKGGIRQLEPGFELAGTDSGITACGSKCTGASSYSILGCSSNYGTNCN